LKELSVRARYFASNFKLRNVRLIILILRLISTRSLREALPDSELSQLSLFRKYKSGVRMYESCSLNSKSNVIILGGYLGNSAQMIFNEYHSNIKIFEPIKDFASACEKVFLNVEQVQVINMAASDHSGSIEMYIDTDSTGTYSTGKAVAVECISFSEYLTSTDQIFDLVEMNIEGGEYIVLEELIKNNALRYSKNWLIQFHENDSSHELLRAQFRNALRDTHELVFSYTWVWELWKANNSSS